MNMQIDRTSANFPFFVSQANRFACLLACLLLSHLNQCDNYATVQEISFRDRSLMSLKLLLLLVKHYIDLLSLWHPKELRNINSNYLAIPNARRRRRRQRDQSLESNVLMFDFIDDQATHTSG